MPETTQIVINTSPLIALVAAWGDLTPLEPLYEKIWVPLEVCQEILRGGSGQFAVLQFEQATWLHKQTTALAISPFLLNALDLGEASVIQLALDQNIATVCIDEAVGRRVARLSGLTLTAIPGPRITPPGAVTEMLSRITLVSNSPTK